MQSKFVLNIIVIMKVS